MLVTQGNLAMTYSMLGRDEQASSMHRDVYSGYVRLNGEEHLNTLIAACNYASSLRELRRFDEAKALLRETTPVVRRVIGESNDLTLKMRLLYAVALYEDAAATLHDLCEAVNMLEELERTARRVFGGAHPLTSRIEDDLRLARAVLDQSSGYSL